MGLYDGRDGALRWAGRGSRMGRDEALTWAETQNPLEEQAEASRLWPGLFQTSGTPSPAGVHCPLLCLTADR